MREIIDRVLAAYGELAGLAFCYGQGSVLTGFTDASDLDLVMVWASGVPADRPARRLADPGAEVKCFDGEFGGLDSMTVEGRQVDVVHHPEAVFDRWLGGEVRQGDGWQQVEWPQPLYAVAGFAYGPILADPHGAARRARESLDAFPATLATKSRQRLSDDWADARRDLERSAERADGWLFHQLAGDLLRVAYVTWFAAHARYCPFPKHLPAWAERFALEPSLVDLERRLWDGALPERLATLDALVEGILVSGRRGGSCPVATSP